MIEEDADDESGIDFNDETSLFEYLFKYCCDCDCDCGVKKSRFSCFSSGNVVVVKFVVF